MRTVLCLSLCAESDQTVLFGCGKPGGIVRLVDQIEQGDESEDHSWCSFESKHPLPAEQAHYAAHVALDPYGEPPTEHAGHGDACKEDRHHRGATVGGKPKGQVKNDAREEACFENPEHKPQHVKVSG